MRRRTLFGLLGLPAAAAMALAARGRSRNPYYEGPVSDHFDGLRFFSPGAATDKGFADLARWQLSADRAAWPESFPSPFRDRPPERSADLRVALVGHATLLVQVAGLNILTDPVYGERASPVSFAGPRRVNPPGIAFEDLPRIDAVLVTHNHYDHLDVDTLGRLWQRDRPRIVTPLGNEAIMRATVSDLTATSLDWGGSAALSDGVAVHCLPANHWSARGIADRRMALWGAFLLTTPAGPIYHVGDTGYGDGLVFRDLRTRFGAPRLAILPIGAYEPRWFMGAQHIDPQEAVKILADTGAAAAVGHHWGTFQLTDEAIEAPAQALAAALAAAGLPPERFRALRPGEVFSPT